MTGHKKITKKKLKLLIVAMCLSLSILTLRAYLNKINRNSSKNIETISSKDAEIKSKDQNAKLTKIAFEKNNNVYLYDEINEQIKSLGDNSNSKDLLQLSPDKTKIVFRSFNEEKEINPPHIIVYDIKTEKSTEIDINNKDVQQIIELKWIDNENILITGHINPSASGYAIYNIKNKLELISCVGTIRDIIINKKSILYSVTPHIFPKPRANLYINGNKIFESIEDKEEIYDGVISKDGKMLAFRSWLTDSKNSNGEVSAYINVAKINNDGKSISDLKKTSINSDITGDLKFDDKNNINIIGDKFIYKLEAGNIIKEKNNLPKQAELSAAQLKKFKQILNKQFPEESILEQTILEDIDIYNVVTF
ncbi:hypothetical protein K2F40_14450 [Clostridium sp. CM028]|uniref:hypothetical protein n=1 Tax=unclassified Clostridium TaxID=2614128 RepID=UPI001C0BE84C|nr:MULTISPECIES: hypothetical protein [unclassified Clostridium]MBU3091302.1 hypothetical protein [Clostridium sp. CF011]MBW9150160.1 hypothetical protein [Clostridium sp. CM028]WAG68610.1 hypothetical protein LL036_10890 [Clostridium sp. CF011]WLC60405.1 hypothetical protein KTC94_09290 [Clostridium sp. CM028]